MSKSPWFTPSLAHADSELRERLRLITRTMNATVEQEAGYLPLSEADITGPSRDVP